MADAMVTARMTQDKKDAANRILEQLGVNPSQAINRLYDYVLEHGRLPFPDEHGNQSRTEEQIAGAIAWADGLRMDGSSGRFDSMTLKEVKRQRLIAKGLVGGGGDDGRGDSR